MSIIPHVSAGFLPLNRATMVATAFKERVLKSPLNIRKAFKDPSNKTWKLLDFKKIPAFILSVIKRE